MKRNSQKEQMMMKKKEEVPVGGVFPFGRRRRRGQHFGQLLSSPCQVPVISIVTDTATLLASRDHLLLLVTCYRIENIPFSGLLAGCRMLLFPTLAGVSFQFLLWTQKKKCLNIKENYFQPKSNDVVGPFGGGHHSSSGYSSLDLFKWPNWFESHFKENIRWNFNSFPRKKNVLLLAQMCRTGSGKSRGQ